MAGCAMSWPPPQSLEGSFFVRSGTVSPSRPAKLHRASRAAAVKTGRRPPAKPARSGLDGGEHGAMLPRVGREVLTTPLNTVARAGWSGSWTRLLRRPAGAPRNYRTVTAHSRPDAASRAALGAPQKIDKDRRQEAFLGVPIIERDIEVGAILGHHLEVFGVGHPP